MSGLTAPDINQLDPLSPALKPIRDILASAVGRQHLLPPAPQMPFASAGPDIYQQLYSPSSPLAQSHMQPQAAPPSLYGPRSSLGTGAGGSVGGMGPLALPFPDPRGDPGTPRGPDVPRPTAGPPLGRDITSMTPFAIEHTPSPSFRGQLSAAPSGPSSLQDLLSGIGGEATMDISRVPTSTTTAHPNADPNQRYYQTRDASGNLVFHTNPGFVEITLPNGQRAYVNESNAAAFQGLVSRWGQPGVQSEWDALMRQDTATNPTSSHGIPKSPSGEPMLTQLPGFTNTTLGMSPSTTRNSIPSDISPPGLDRRKEIGY